jgi:hypothetical protein
MVKADDSSGTGGSFTDASKPAAPVDKNPASHIVQRPPTRPGNRVFALALVIFSVFAFSQAYAISGLKGLTTGGVMPMVASAVMCISSVFILAQSFRGSAEPPTTPMSVRRYLLPLPLVCFTVIVATYAWLIPRLGFVLASGLFLFVSISMLWRKGPVVTLLITGLSIAVIHLLFRIVFQVVLPTGTLWQ